MSKEVGAYVESKSILRFPSPPENFSGDLAGVKSLNWIKKMQRLKDVAGFPDREIILVAADHLVGRANVWYEVVASKRCESWSDFVVAFKSKYCDDQVDLWWHELDTLRQGRDESVEDVDVRLREVCFLLDITDERTMIRRFLKAIHESLAYDIEREENRPGFKRNKSSYDAVVLAAARLEKVNNKYHRGSSGVSVVLGGESGVSSGVSEAGTISDLLNEFRQLKISMLNVVGRPRKTVTATNPNVMNTSAPVRKFLCYDCGEPGHKKWDCPRRQAESTTATVGSGPATGANAIPLAGAKVGANGQDSGKDQEHRL